MAIVVIIGLPLKSLPTIKLMHHSDIRLTLTGRFLQCVQFTMVNCSCWDFSKHHLTPGPEKGRKQLQDQVNR